MTATNLFPYDEYYGHSLVFKVEDVYFTAFKTAITRPGSFFESVFSLPKLGSQPSMEGIAEGSSPENPITLHGISKKNFRNLLRVLCPFEGIPPCNTYDEWIGVLDLASMWDFQTIRATAISNISPFLESIPVIDRILVARKYEVKAWLVDALAPSAISDFGL
ncbi:hypothetical protein BJ165DRAFT_1403360 [Panaeolus papilionaceus]|nr:hypothetical protein BJ165DRAFT_1403360 [Panaeolus papilionaceus]